MFQLSEFQILPTKPVSDVWSFAATLYHLLTGKFPYRFDPKRDPIDIILNENPVPIRERLPGLAKEIATTIDKSLVRNPKDTLPGCGETPRCYPLNRSPSEKWRFAIPLLSDSISKFLFTFKSHE